MKQTLKIGITVLAVAALAMSGVALAQTTEDDTVEIEDTRAYQALQEQLAPLVEDGTISQEQADAVAAALAENLPRLGGGRGLRALRATADFLDLTPEEMREALSEYETLADLAAANGSSGDELIAYLVAQVEEHLEEAVDAGRITQEEADEKLADAEEHITEMVNSEIPEPGDRPLGRGGRGPGFGDQPGV
jgi:polyhydroxyalkanoate synthesis regulator phasin